MKKEGVIAVLLLILLIPGISASSVDEEIKKLTHYCEDYETGNINYAQLIVHTSSIRESLNEVLGAVDSMEGGLLKQEQIREILGEPDSYTKWVWVEGEDHDEKLDEELPEWRRIVFDGKKIQVRLGAHPSLFKRKDSEEIIYRLNFDVEFKRPEEQINIERRISEIKEIAEDYSSDPSSENLEKLAKECFNAERAFESSFRQGGGNCEEVMNSIFGSENKRREQNLIVQEIEFYDGEDFEAIGRLEFCDDCEWKWINLNMWLNMRKPMNDEKSEPQKKYYEDFEAELTKILDGMKQALDNRDFAEFNRLNAELWPLNDEWNRASNDVWNVVEKEYEAKRNPPENNEDPYWWIEFEKQKRERIREIQEANYQKRKAFYELLFSRYDKKEYFFAEVEWQRRLIEEFEEVSDREICDNSVDDNNNGETDCEEDVCGGKICGWKEIIIEEKTETVPEPVELVIEKSNETVETEELTEENETESSLSAITGNIIEEIEETEEEEPAVFVITKKVPLYCIASVCQEREEEEEEKARCGNHICEEGEKDTCKEDCSVCPVYPPLECRGKVIFSGKDENGCPLKPVCIEEKDTCETQEDCEQPLCGEAECQEGRCVIGKIEECQEAECVEGEEKSQTCPSGEKRTVKICENRVWIPTGVEACSNVEEVEEDSVGDECDVREDCGNENDVCSNGKCVTLPEKQETTGEETTNEQVPEPEPMPEPESGPEEITGSVISGRPIEEPEPVVTVPETTIEPETVPKEGYVDDISEQEDLEQQRIREEQKRQEEELRWQTEQEERERQEEEERQRKIQECKEESKKKCEERYINDCLGRCIFKEGEERDTEECKEECRAEHERDINDCVVRCGGICETGEWCEIDFSSTHTRETLMFSVSGVCRQSQTQDEAFIYFDAWGDSLQNFHELKNKYYSGYESEWCKWESENLIKQRKEIEKSFNQEFAVWFFEKHLANSAEDWDQHISGIYELYWKNVEIQRRLAEMSKCSGQRPEFNLINFSYDTEYGSVEYWEEIQTVNLEGIGEVTLISPYMRLWVFPPEEFIKHEMKASMENGEFPGSPEEKLERGNQEGLTEEEKESIREDSSFMEDIRKLSEKYGGSVDGVIEVRDSTGDVVFNLYIQVNEEDILIIKPMLPEEVPEKDVSVTVEFEKIYEMIMISEKDMMSEQVQNPPWDKGRIQPVKRVKEVINGIRMYFKMREIVNSAEYSPPDAEKDVKSLIYSFMFKHMKEEPLEGEMTDEEKQQARDISDEVLGSKEVLTGEVILR